MNKLQQELNKEHTSKLLKTHPFDEKVSLPPPYFTEKLQSSTLDYPKGKGAAFE